MLVYVYYYALKLAFFFGLVYNLIRFDALGRHIPFLAALYTAGVALLSWVFLISPRTTPPSPDDWRAWGIWLGVTFVVTWIYFKLLDRFDSGILFYTMLLLGAGFVLGAELAVNYF